MTGRWFTNTMHPKADVLDWERWSIGSKVAAGEPRATQTATVEELRRMKMHGLYEVHPGVPALPRDEDCPGYKP